MPLPVFRADCGNAVENRPAEVPIRAGLLAIYQFAPMLYGMTREATQWTGVLSGHPSRIIWGGPSWAHRLAVSFRSSVTSHSRNDRALSNRLVSFRPSGCVSTLMYSSVSL